MDIQTEQQQTLCKKDKMIEVLVKKTVQYMLSKTNEGSSKN